MNKYQQKHIITLSSQEEQRLHTIIRTGTHKARTIKRAQILLRSYRGLKDEEIAERVEVHVTTVERIRVHYAQGGLNRALYDAPRSGQPPKLDEKAEAHLVAIACSDPPKGRHHWTLELLQRQMIHDKQVTVISTVAIWKRLKERGIKPWREKNVVHSQGNSPVH